MRGLAELADEIIERRGGDRAFARQVLDVVGAEIGDDDFVTATHQAARHVGAHLAEADHP